ncbi:MAG: zinc-ribbon domain-containing protein [Thermoplasmatota archaeon]
MLCPVCSGNNLSTKRESVSDPYDFKKEKEKLFKKKKAASDYEAKYFAEQKLKEAGKEMTPAKEPSNTRHCPLCGYPLREEWKFCPECGVSLIKK